MSKRGRTEYECKCECVIKGKGKKKKLIVRYRIVTITLISIHEIIKDICIIETVAVKLIIKNLAFGIQLACVIGIKCQNLMVIVLEYKDMRVNRKIAEI